MFQTSVLLIAIIAALDMFFITTKLQIERMFNFFIFFFTKLEFRQIYPVLFHNWGIELQLQSTVFEHSRIDSRHLRKQAICYFSILVYFPLRKYKMLAKKIKIVHFRVCHHLRNRAKRHYLLIGQSGSRRPSQLRVKKKKQKFFYQIQGQLFKKNNCLLVVFVDQENFEIILVKRGVYFWKILYPSWICA